MSNSPTNTVNISRTPGLSNPVWMEKTVHNKETDTSTTYLFQREGKKPTLWRNIKDFFAGIKSAGEQLEKHLGGQLHYKDSQFTQQRLKNPLKIDKNKPTEAAEVVSRLERHIGGEGSKTFTRDPIGLPKDQDEKVTVNIETKDSFLTKESWARKIDHIKFDSKKINPSDVQKLKKIAYFCIDASTNRSEQKSKSEIVSMMRHVDKIMPAIPASEKDSQFNVARLHQFLSIELKKL